MVAFAQGLQELGWTDGRNVRIDTRWSAADADLGRRYAAELVALAPDVILASGGTVVGALLQASRTVPIVFTLTVDPVGAGFVASLARPGGNATGFTGYEYGLSGKWLELLKEVAPRVTRAGVIRDPAITAGIGQFAAIQSVAPSLGVEVSAVNVRDAGEIERAVTAFARSPNGGLIVTGGGLAMVHRNLIITLAARHKLPAVYAARDGDDALQGRRVPPFRFCLSFVISSGCSERRTRARLTRGSHAPRSKQGRTPMTMRPDPTFHASPKLAMEAPPENFAYTLLLSPDFSKPDALAVIDVKPGSPTFSQIVHTVTMPYKGDEFHHFGWNACSSSLSPLTGHAFLERRYLIIPGLRSSRIYIVDTKPDPTTGKNPQDHRARGGVQEDRLLAAPHCPLRSGRHLRQHARRRR